MQFMYLLSICIGLIGMGFIDYRYKLALFYAPKRTLLVIFTMVLIFLLWDIAGTILGIFFSGGSRYILGVYVLPEIPIEELFFLTLLSYMPLVLYRKFTLL